jgi:hypothetical protein
MVVVGSTVGVVVAVAIAVVASSLTSRALPWAQLATVKTTRFMSFDGRGKLAPRTRCISFAFRPSQSSWLSKLSKGGLVSRV